MITELCKLEDDASLALSKWESEMHTFSDSFVNALQSELHCADRYFSHLKRCFSDEKGFHFSIEIRTGISKSSGSFVQFDFVANRQGLGIPNAYEVRQDGLASSIYADKPLAGQEGVGRVLSLSRDEGTVVGYECGGGHRWNVV